MKLIVGLGNPGKKYEHTRHNLGFMVVDTLVAEHGGSWQNYSAHSATCKLGLGTNEVLLLKPQTFMNESGTSVAEVVGFYKIEPQDMWVVHDDLDLPFAKLKSSFDSSAAGHRGVQSIIDALGSQKFNRLRLGIGRPPEPTSAETFVLQPFTTDEQQQLGTIVGLALQKLEEELKK